jgi:hypothetical protein
VGKQEACGDRHWLIIASDRTTEGQQAGLQTGDSGRLV